MVVTGMSPELLSILVLGLIFVIATVLPVNIGVLAFVAAFLVGAVVADQSTDDIIGGFPSDLFLTLVGITYLFAVAQNNGTVDWLVELAVRAVRGRIGATPRYSPPSAPSAPARSPSSPRSRSASPSSTRSARCSWGSW
jgi:Dicarboxylate carrier protein MatC N-terminus